MKIIGADHTNWRVRDLQRSLHFYRDVLGLEPFGLEEFNRCSRSPGNPHVEEPQTIAHEGGIFLTAVRLGAYSEVGYLAPSFRVRSLGL
jgi:catechol 2,3-dioxygenase-like lactoylglutathione lyase family enzyme